MRRLNAAFSLLHLFLTRFALYGLSGRQRPDLEVLDVDLIVSQDCSLKGV